MVGIFRCSESSDRSSASKVRSTRARIHDGRFSPTVHFKETDMRYFHAGIAAAICVVAVFAVGGCSQPKSGTYFEPEITASHDGIFSSDVTFWLNSVNRIDWSRGDDDTVTSSKTPELL
jgi:hypothetical protein